MRNSAGSSTSHTFSQIPRAEIQRSSFDRSSAYISTLDAGYLVPWFVDEALPGDTFNLKSTVVARLTTPIKPLMDNLFMDFHFFAVPMRILWDHWVNMNGEQRNPDDSTDYVTPICTAPAGGYAFQSVQDYMGLMPGVSGYEHSAMPLRAYNQIYNHWFRDENLQDSVPENLGDGPDAPTDYVLLKRGKRHDYFTSCLPWPQKGPAVDLPIGARAPVFGDGKAATWTDGTNYAGMGVQAGSGFYSTGGNLDVNVGTVNSATSTLGSNKTINLPTSTAGHDSHIYADLSQATAATINQLREAFQIQRMYEKDARGGTRYPEVIQAHFGVTNPDSRMQWPEYLGGGSQPINVNPIAQTSATVDGVDTPQGNLAAIGTFSAHGIGFTKSFTEHCIIIGLVSVRADLTYQQGLNRMWSRSTRFDYYWPSFAHLGEQAVLNKEIYVQGTSADGDVFGYQERFAEYRYKPSQVTGQMRSTFAQTLDVWHLAQKFTSLPTLGDDFIKENPPMARILATGSSEPAFQFNAYAKLRCARPMPMYSVPGLIDHF